MPQLLHFQMGTLISCQFMLEVLLVILIGAHRKES